MDPYREPLLVDPSSLSLPPRPGRIARFRGALTRMAPETAFRLLVIFLLANVVATSAGTAVSLELQRREAGKLEHRLSTEVAAARQELRDTKSELTRERAAERANALRAARTAPLPPARGSSSMLPTTLDPVTRDAFERAQRRSFFPHLPLMEQRALPARDLARKLQATGADVSVEDIQLSDGLRARARLSWQEMLGHPATFFEGIDRLGTYTVRPQDSTLFRVLGLTPGDVLLSVNGMSWVDEELCSSQCGALTPDLFDRSGSLTLEVLHEGSRQVRSFHWSDVTKPGPARFGRVR